MGFQSKGTSEENSESSDDMTAKWFQMRYNRLMTACGVFVVLLLVLVVISMTVMLMKHESPNIRNIMVLTVPDFDSNAEVATKTTSEQPSVNLALPHSTNLRIISREEWKALNPIKPSPPLHLPVEYIIISHTVSSNCFTMKSCSDSVNKIQHYHQNTKHWSDITYNFLVGGDGNAYEGRGWKIEGDHTKDHNSQSIGIAFIGTFSNALPSEQQIIAAQKLIERGVELGFVSADYKLLGARQAQATLSPGEKLYNNLKSWPHWAEGRFL